MTAKNVTNNSVGTLVLPNGVSVESKATVLVKNWERIESSDVLQAWIAAEALTIEDSNEQDDETDTSNTPNLIQNDQNNGGDNGGTTFVPKTKDELEGLTNADLASYIEKDLGGTVKSGSTKADLLKQADELQAAKAQPVT